jgi:hypothetical protein
MKLLLRAFLIIVTLLCIDTFFNACKKTEHFKYKFSAVEISLFSQDKVNPIRQIKTNDDTLKFEYIYFDTRLEGGLVAKADLLPGLFTNSAYAKSYLENSSNAVLLKEIKVTSVFPYNAAYTEKSNINNALRFAYKDNKQYYDSVDAEGFIKFYNDNIRVQGDEESKKVSDSFIIYLNEKPTSNTTQQFAIEIDLEDGTILRDTTVRFIVK